MKLEAPVVVHELGNVLFFPSIEAAQLEFEPPDVSDNAYEFFSAAGRRMHLRAVGPRVVLEFAEEQATASAQLRTSSRPRSQTGVWTSAGSRARTSTRSSPGASS